MLSSLKLLMAPESQELLGLVNSLIAKTRTGNEVTTNEALSTVVSAKTFLQKYGNLFVTLSNAPVSVQAASVLKEALSFAGIDVSEADMEKLLLEASKIAEPGETILSFLKNGRGSRFVQNLFGGNTHAGQIITSMCPNCGTHFFKEL